MKKRLGRVVLVVLLLTAGGFAAPFLPPPLQVEVSAQQTPPQPQDEFIPIDELPPQDQLPAAPLLIAAYSFVVLALFAYIVSVARRLGVVQKELDRLNTDVKRGRA